MFLIFTRQGIDIEEFPAIKKHLAQFRSQLEPEPAGRKSKSKWPGRKAGSYKWFEIQDQTTYWPELEKKKIISTKVSITPTFTIDESASYLGNTSYCIAIDDSQTYVVSILNSLISFFYCKKVFLDKESGWFEVQPDGLEAFPIPPATAADKARLTQLAEACAAAAQRGDEATLAVHEAEINQIVYRLFDLTPDEIALIESALAPTRTTTPARKRARAVAAAVTDNDPTPEAATVAEPAKAKPAAAKPAPTAAWLSDELFNVEGELPLAKKAKAVHKAAPTKNAPTPVDQTQRDEVLAVIRELFSTGSARDRDTALWEVAQALGYARVGSRIRDVLHRDLLTAVRRGILQNEGGELSLLCRSIEDYERDFLKEQFLAAIHQNGRVWREREAAIRLFARWLGYRRTGKLIDATARSLINGLLREGSLEKDGQDRIRRA